MKEITKRMCDEVREEFEYFLNTDTLQEVDRIRRALQLTIALQIKKLHH